MSCKAPQDGFRKTGMPFLASFRNPMICCSVKRFLMLVNFSENEL